MLFSLVIAEKHVPHGHFLFFSFAKLQIFSIFALGYIIKKLKN